MIAHTDTCGCRECVKRERRRAASTRHRQRKKAGLVEPRPRQATAPKPKAAISLADLFTTPELPGALCRGKWALFDPADTDDHQVVAQLHREAIALCRRCPALAACQTWIESLPAQQRPVGVVAGRLITEEM